ncbi:MAG: hypothetical protein Q4G16_04750 [Cruoricaptor ignavus]|nr:hypothetical protein [Cruoricaptor ignavus]
MEVFNLKDKKYEYQLVPFLILEMKKYLLFIKSKINQGASAKNSPMLDFYFKRFTDKYYLFLYLFYFIFFLPISASSIGFASEDKVLLHYSNQSFYTINFFKLTIILVLQVLFWKTIVSEINKNSYSILMNSIKLNIKNKNEQYNILFKTIFFTGFSFRILITSLLVVIFMVKSYFPVDFLPNLIIAIIVILAVILFIHSLECLLFYVNTKWKINYSVFTIILFTIGFISFSFLQKTQELSGFQLLFILLSLFGFTFLIRYFVQNRL